MDVGWWALIVSGISVIAAFIAVGQTARYHPKPYFKAEVRPDTADRGAPTFSFEVVNIGRAEASDVEITVGQVGGGRRDEVWRGISMEVGTPVGGDVSMVDGTAEFPFGGMGRIVPKGAPRNLDLIIHMTWRQWPTIKRVRRLTWRVSTNADGVVRMHSGRERGVLTTVVQEVWDGIIDVLTGVLDGVRRVF